MTAFPERAINISRALGGAPKVSEKMKGKSKWQITDAEE